MVSAVVFAAAIAGCLALTGSAAVPSARSANPAPPNRPAFEDGVVLAAFTHGSTKAQQNGAVQSAGATDTRTIGVGVHVLKVPPGHVLAAIQRLREHPGIRYAEPDYIEHLDGVPNDPSFGLQWGYQNTGQTVNGISGTPGADERAVPAWDVARGSRSIVIGEVDTGVDYTHPDLSANIWSNPGGIGGCSPGTHGYNVIARTCDPMDDDTVFGGHGTHVAGIMGAVGDNGVGVTGVNQAVTILPVKWVNSSGSGSTSNLISALDWLVKAKQAGVNIRVVNDSQTWSGTAPSQPLSDEIDLLGQNGILFVTAAGNSGANNDNPAVRRWPCGYARSNEICVTASDQRDQLPSWANYGQTTVDLAAPGNNIYSTLRNGTYGYVSGGSMASPQVAGAAALILSVQDMSTLALKADILENVDPVAALSNRVRTGGRLDVCRALPGCTLPPTVGTFGLQTVGGNSDRMAADRQRVNRFQLSVGGSVSKLTMYLAPTGTGGQQVLKGLIYADQGGSPGALLAVSNEFTFHSTDAAGWYDFGFSSPVSLQAGSYWIGVISGPGSYVAGFRWKSVSGSRAVATVPYGSGPSDPFGAATFDAEQMSVYATYTASASSPPPVFNVTPPAVQGTTQQGQILTGTTGDWVGGSTYAYQWRRCGSSGSACADIAGAVSATYQPVTADVGSTMQVAVTASDGSNTSTAYSPPSTVVQGAPPPNTFGKTTIGVASDNGTADFKRVSNFAVGQDVSVTELTIYLARAAAGQQVLRGVIYADQGGAPGALLALSNEVTFGTSATSGWFDLPFASPVNLQAGTYWLGMIDGQTTNVIALRYDSVTNSSSYAADSYSDGPSDPFGSRKVDDKQISVYATYTSSQPPPAPVNVSPPTISGTAQQGQTMTAQPGTWSNGPTSYAYQWRDCDSSGSNCSDIAGGTSATYVATSADVSSTLRVAVTATNTGGSTTASSAQTGVVQPPAPSTGTFGLSTIGVNSDRMLANRQRVNRFQLSVGGSVSKLTMYLAPTGTGGQQVLKGLIYADQGGSPGALLAVSNEFTFHSTDAAGWYDFGFSSPVSLQAGSYWIGVISGPGSYVAGFRWNSVSGSRAVATVPYGSGPSDPFGAATFDAEQMSIYATYTTP